MKRACVFIVFLTSLAAWHLDGQALITVAGGNLGDGGPANVARVGRPNRASVDASGNLYIADLLNNRIRRVDAATQVITTVAGGGFSGFSGDGGPATAAALSGPWDVTVDAAGNLYIADTGNARVRKVDTATHIITTVAGNGTSGFSGDGGPAVAAALSLGVRGLKTDASGNLYIVDTFNSRIRKVDAATHVITTIAGTGDFDFGGDGGPATSAKFNFLQDIAFDSAGNLYIADTNNGRIRRVDAATKIITTVAGGSASGFSGDGGPAVAAGISAPYAVAVDAIGNLYIGDTLNFRVRRVDAATKVITTVAGIGFTTSFSGDGGPAASASLSLPSGVSVDSSGNLYITDTGNYRVRKVNAATGIISTYAGGTEGTAGDGGPASAAELLFPGDVAVDSSGNLYIADSADQRIRRVDTATKIITTIAGNGVRGFSGDGALATSAAINFPNSVAVDAAGNVYFADTSNARVRRVDAGTKIITTVAGTGALGLSGDGGPAVSAMLNTPLGVMVDPSGNLYIADASTATIRRVDAATKIITTVAGNGTRDFAGDGGLATAAALSSPSSVARDAAGNLYIADTGNGRIRKINAATKIITTVAVLPAGGQAPASPHGIALDAAGNIYVADSNYGVVRKVDAATGNMTTIAGNGQGGFSGDGIPATSESLGGPEGVAVDASGVVYIADSFNNRIRAVMNVPLRRRAVRKP